MSVYVDGYVLPVKKARLDEYRQLAQMMAGIFLKHGALEVHECVADDVKPGKLTSFPQSVQLQDDEVVVFSWIVYPSREVRDTANAKAMADPACDGMEMKNMPFDGARMFFGGFREIVGEKAAASAA